MTILQSLKLGSMYLKYAPSVNENVDISRYSLILQGSSVKHTFDHLTTTLLICYINCA